jgi:ABC-type cobalt transport system substrate-binding protein
MNRRNRWILIGIVVAGLFCGALVRAQSGQSSVADDEALSQVAAIEPIDTHLHAYQDVAGLPISSRVSISAR